MSNIKISIITPTYNSEKTVERTIQSVLNQDYPNLEYIIIDGLSSDRTLYIVNKYRDKIAIIESGKDKNISQSFNKGIAKATGDVIGIINSDDFFLPGALQKIADEFDGESDIYQGNILMEDAETGFRCREIPSKTFPKMPLLRHVAHQGMFVTREGYKKFGVYDEDIRWPMDLEFLMRADRLGAKFHRIEYDMAVFVAGGFTSKSIIQKKDDYINIVLKNGGNRIQAYLYYLSLVGIQITKKILNIVLPDFGQKLRYKKA
jgi:glycosyltransferase involved in cell wall biosynthesis